MTLPAEYGIMTSAGEVLYLANPTAAVTLQVDKVTEQERSVHSEFFDGRPGLKTGARYLRIRNHILQMWSVN